MIDYISAVKDGSKAKKLELKMSEFYRSHHSYYDNIDYVRSTWFNKTNLFYQDILNRCVNKKICEIGCGRSGILETKKVEQFNYSGCDFSSDLLQSNRI